MIDTQPCCICGEPVPPPYNLLGGRVYCARHFAAVNKPHPGVWRAGAMQIAIVALFAAVVALLAGQAEGLTGAALVGVGLVVALVPTALWLVYFYRQDRLEPEPKASLALVFGIALLLTESVGRHVVRDWFRVDSWAVGSVATSLLAAILISGFTYQAITYVAIRVVYATPEFDERMDGIVYGTIAGLGLATLLNVRYVLDNGGVALAPGAIHVATTALAQASFGGLLGYIMAEARFVHRPVFWVPLGFACVAALNGLFSWLIAEVSSTGLTVSPWRSLLLGLIVALAVFAALIALMRRSVAVTLARPAS